MDTALQKPLTSVVSRVLGLLRRPSTPSVSSAEQAKQTAGRFLEDRRRQLRERLDDHAS